MPDVVLDASALLALLNREPGGASVFASLPGARISAVNLAEVVAKLSDYGMKDQEIRLAVGGLGLDVVTFDEELAHRSGTLRPATRELGLSLGDRACLALGIQGGATVLTTDRDWSRLELDVTIRIAR